MTKKLLPPAIATIAAWTAFPADLAIEESSSPRADSGPWISASW